MSPPLLALALIVAAPCPSRLGVTLSDEAAGARLRFLESRIDLGARRSGTWALTWGLTYATAASLQFGLSPLADPGTRIDLYVGGTSATIGTLTRAIMIPRVIKERRRLRRRPTGEERCTRLLATELALERSARAERFGRSLALHLAIIGYNTAIGLVLGIALDRPLSGNRQAVIGRFAGEMLILSQPQVMTRSLDEYWGRPTKPVWRAQPLVLPGGGGVMLGGRM